MHFLGALMIIFFLKGNIFPQGKKIFLWKKGWKMSKVITLKPTNLPK